MNWKDSSISQWFFPPLSDQVFFPSVYITIKDHVLATEIYLEKHFLVCEGEVCLNELYTFTTIGPENLFPEKVGDDEIYIDRWKFEWMSNLL
jgi:hypothetical protein